MIGKKTRTRVTDSIDELRRMRDELRLEIHLARMEAKERWKTFERDVRASINEMRRR